MGLRKIQIGCRNSTLSNFSGSLKACTLRVHGLVGFFLTHAHFRAIVS